MFQVKATVIGFQGNEERYPCHFRHKVGEEFIFDGEKFVGRCCPSMIPVVVPRMMIYHAAGPRMIPPASAYYPFWYAPASLIDPSRKIYDGVGYKNVLENFVEPELYKLTPVNAYKWPPHPERTVNTNTSIVMCNDNKTYMTMKVEAFDLSDKGYDIPFFRRQMGILAKVLPKPGIVQDKILNEFTPKQIEEIYPALSQIMINILAEELVLMGYLQNQQGKMAVTSKGESKLQNFKNSLSQEERNALEL
jgi:uncharacterized repeat protein (TIGR04076 family)